MIIAGSPAGECGDASPLESGNVLPHSKRPSTDTAAFAVAQYIPGSLRRAGFASFVRS